MDLFIQSASHVASEVSILKNARGDFLLRENIFQFGTTYKIYFRDEIEERLNFLIHLVFYQFFKRHLKFKIFINLNRSVLHLPKKYLSKILEYSFIKNLRKSLEPLRQLLNYSQSLSRDNLGSLFHQLHVRCLLFLEISHYHANIYNPHPHTRSFKMIVKILSCKMIVARVN